MLTLYHSPRSRGSRIRRMLTAEPQGYPHDLVHRRP